MQEIKMNIIRILVASIVFQGLSLAQDSLNLSISVPKSTFVEGEGIWVTINLTNKSSQEFPIWSFSVHESSLKIFVINSREDTLPYGSYIVSGGAEKPFHVIKANDGLWIMYDLLGITGAPEIPHSGYRCFFLPKGEYKIFVEGYLKEVLGGASDKPNIRSNIIHFTVTQPMAEEAEVRKLYRDGLTALLKRDYKMEESLFLKIINEHPNSAYVSKAIFELVSTYRVILNEEEKGDKLINWFLDNFPNDELTYVYLRHRLSKMKNDNERETYLNSIKSKHPNSFQAKYANKLIREEAYMKEARSK